MILLSFDIEEFDVPKEHQVDISMEEQIKVSVEGTTRILDCLERNQVKATFFCTANFALHAPDIINAFRREVTRLLLMASIIGPLKWKI